ncbi:MAG: hypothetical protein ACRBBW_16280 [Cellvibrionaceae bacterium]
MSVLAAVTAIKNSVDAITYLAARNNPELADIHCALALVEFPPALFSERELNEIKNRFTQTQTHEGSIDMSQQTPVVKKTLVFGQDVATMSEGDLISKITAAKAKIEELSRLDVNSRRIKQQVEELIEAVNVMVEKLDENMPEETTAE